MTIISLTLSRLNSPPKELIDLFPRVYQPAMLPWSLIRFSDIGELCVADGVIPVTSSLNTLIENGKYKTFDLQLTYIRSTEDPNRKVATIGLINGCSLRKEGNAFMFTPPVKDVSKWVTS